MSVTYPGKRYIAVCAGCDCLFDSVRSDKVTCSPACRVKAHRSGRLRSLKATSALLDVRPSIVQQCVALDRLRPDLTPQVTADALALEQAMPDVVIAFDKLLMVKARERTIHDPSSN